VPSRPDHVEPEFIELTFVVAREFSGWRADRYIAHEVPRLSRTRVQRILKDHAFDEAGLPVKPNRPLRAGERITVYKRPPDEPDARAVEAYGAQEGLEVRFIRRMNLAIGGFSVVIGGTGGDCSRCNRLRLSCNGLVRPCLFSDLGFSVRELGPREAIRRALLHKPKCGTTSEAMFHTIGG
jgi:hypothetical protein